MHNCNIQLQEYSENAILKVENIVLNAMTLYGDICFNTELPCIIVLYYYRNG